MEPFNISVDEYTSDRMDAVHLSPRLIIEKPLLPTWTVWVASDGQGGRIQRWFDVTPDVLNGIGIRSIDFIHDGIAKLIDKDGNEIYRIQAKLTDEFDDLPLILARIEKVWYFAKSGSDFWSKACDILIRSQVPTVKEIEPGSELYKVYRTGWLEIACYWIAFMSKIRHEKNEEDWDNFISGDKLIFKYIHFYNESPFRGPELRDPCYNADRVHLSALLEAVRKSSTNKEKKETLEALSEALLKGIAGFEVLPSKNTATGEVDRIVRNTVSHPILSRLGSHILVECKHWKKTIGTDEVGSLIIDIQDAGSNSGILFCRKPISRPAKQRINNIYQRNKIFIIVITENEINETCQGANLMDS